MAGRWALAAALLVAAVAKAGTRAKYGDADILVTGGSAAGGLSRLTSSYPAAAVGSLTARAGQNLVVQFDVTNAASGAALVPHQAFVRFTNKASGVITTFAAAPDSGKVDKAGVHKLTLDMNDRKALYTAAQSGTYDVDVVVGDAAIENPVVWRIGTVELQPPAAAAKAAPPLYTQPLLHESDITLKALPEIAHAFREPEKRPPFVVSLAASALVVGALAVWAMYVFGSIGVQLAAPSLSTLVFFASFAAVLGLFAVYWLGHINMFVTLGYLCALAIPTAFFGRRMLVESQEVATGVSAAKKTQ